MKRSINKKGILLFIIINLLILTGCTGINSHTLKKGIISGQVTINKESTTAVPVNIEQIEGYNSVKLQPVRQQKVTTGEYLLQVSRDVKTGVIENELLAGRALIKKKINTHTYKIKFKRENIDRGILDDLKNNPLVSGLEPDYPLYTQEVPQDPEYHKQWNLHQLQMEAVWESAAGGNGITVAVIDTGILPGHPDLKDNIIAGYDFVDDDGDPTDTSGDFSHGTHVAGIIGAVTGNGRGIAGIGRNIKIMPIRVIGDGGNGGYGNLIEGIYWAVDNGARIINLSLAGTFESQMLREAVQYAVNRGTTVVAAAGNNGSPPVLYPARFPEVISVGAVGPDKRLAYYSSYGPGLDLVAPGGDSSSPSPLNTILSTAGHRNQAGEPVYQYTWSEGTSMAAPHVTGIIALLHGAGITDPAAIKTRLRETATELEAGSNTYGAGLVSATGALNIPGSYTSGDMQSPALSNITDNSTLTGIKIFTADITGKGSGETAVLKPDGNFCYPDIKGRFSLQVKEGKPALVAWLDKNQNGVIDKGDYFTLREDIRVKAGQSLKLTLELKRVRKQM